MERFVVARLSTDTSPSVQVYVFYSAIIRNQLHASVISLLASHLPFFAIKNDCNYDTSGTIGQLFI